MTGDVKPYVIGCVVLGLIIIALGVWIWTTGNTSGGAVIVIAVGLPTLGIGVLAWWIDRFLDRNTPR